MTRELNDLKCLLETLEIEQKDGLKFANINVEGLYNNFTMNDKGFFTMDELDKFKKYLNLTGQETKEELRAIRNTIVKYYSDHVEEYYDKSELNGRDSKDFTAFDKFQDQMSAFTGMIDYLMMDINESLQEEFKKHATVVGQPGHYTFNLTVSDDVGGTWFGDMYFNTKEEVIKYLKKNRPGWDIVIASEEKKAKFGAQQEIILAKLIEGGLDAKEGNEAPNIIIGNHEYEIWETSPKFGQTRYGYSIKDITTNKYYKVGPFFVNHNEIELAKAIAKEEGVNLSESYRKYKKMNEISDELADEFLRRRVQNAVNANYEDEELNRKEEKAVTALIKRKRRQGKPLTDDEKEYLEKNESYKKQPNDFQKALDLIKFGKNKKDKTTYENYLNSFEREGKLNLFTNYCLDKGLKISDIKPETILEEEQKETPYIIYGKTKEQKTFKAMDMNKGVQVNNLIRATLIYEPKDKLEGYVEELKKENPDWEFKFKKA